MIVKSLSKALPFFLFTSAYSQEPQQADEIVFVIGQQESYLDPTVSSATKSPTDSFDLPLTVNVINDVFLRDLRAETLADAYGYTTGLSRSGINANSFTLRGLAASLQSVQVNGLPGLASRFGSPTTANVERMEVLKGPASVLYGQLEPGGLVNIVTKKPQQESSVNLDISLQSFDTGVSDFGEDMGVTTTFDTTGAFRSDGSWLYRMIASVESIDSFRDDVDFNNYYLFPTLTYLASDVTEVTFGLEILNEEGKADDGLVAINNDIKQTAPINVRYQEPDDEDSDKAIVAFSSFNTRLNEVFDFTLNWRSVWHEDTRILFENNRVNDAENPEEASLRRRDRHQLNKREYHFIDMNSRGTITLGSVEHELLIGFNSGFEKRDFERIRFGANVAPDINVLAPELGQGQASVIQSGNDRVTDLWNYGAYLQDTVKVNEHWIFMAGLRFEQQDVDFVEQVSNIEDEQSSDAWVPMTGIVYQPSENLSLYASYGESFNPNSVERSDANDKSFDPEKGEQIEVGLKSFFFDERANLSLAYFDITKDNIVERNANRDYELLGEIESTGLELEFLALPIDNWQIKAGYAYVDASIARSPSLTTEGNPAAFAPKDDAYLWTRYNVNQSVYGGLLGFSLGVNYESERFSSADSLTRVELPSYTKADFAVYLEFGAEQRKNFSLAFNIENVFDKTYFDGGSNDTRLYPGEPRKITVSFSGKF